MNPSGAEADVNDLTIVKECNWTKRLGFGRYVKVNVGSYRWTDSTTLGGARVDLSHPDNLPRILELAAAADTIIVATGAPPDALIGHARATFRALRAAGCKAKCLGVTRDGWPKHSSRLGYATPFVDYSL